MIVAAFALEVFLAQPQAGSIGRGLLPRFAGEGSIYVAIGILGATVMPHVIYLHSALTQHRIEGKSDEQRRRIYHFERVDVIVAMSIAGLINLAMLTTAAAVTGLHPFADAGDITTVYGQLGRVLGDGSGTIFAIALLASGLSSSTVGTMAGQIVMQGFVERSIPMLLRRTITLAPSLVVLAVGVDPTAALVLSQVVLSFGIPFALIPLLVFCQDQTIMQGLVNRRRTTRLAWLVAALVSALNVFLLYTTLWWQATLQRRDRVSRTEETERILSATRSGRR